MGLSPLILDVRPDLAQGQEPFAKIMQAVGQLRAGQELLLLAPFEPVLLYGVLEHQGFTHHTEQLAPNEWQVTFRPDPAATVEQETHRQMGHTTLPGEEANPPQHTLMKTVSILRAEHTAILQLLDQLEQAAAASERGIPIPADIFQDIQEFFTIFVDRCHHGKEEAEIFPRLQHGHAALIERLEAEHATGRQSAFEFNQAVQTYLPGQAGPGSALAAAARAYVAFLRRHIDQETQELFPVLEQELWLEDQQLVDAFERIEEERIGSGTHERLHRMIDGLAGRLAPFLVAGYQ